jgi:Xaa-Pro aminopeptidase
MTVAVSSVTDARLGALRELLDAHGLDAALLSRSANKRWFSGFRLGHGEEATSGFSGTLLVTRAANLILADSRYTEQAGIEAPDWALVSTTRALHVELPPLLVRHEIASLGMEAAAVSHADWAALAEAAPGTELHAFDDELVPLRVRKSPDEVDAIARACAITDACFDHLVEVVRPGMTERAVAWELESFFRDNGAEGLAFEPIVLAGARAAMPHGRPSDAIVERGNVLLIDFGCSVDGYRSDMTRTLFVGDVPIDIRRYHDAVREAQQAAIGALAVGVNGQDVDAVARRRIEAEGVPSYGHGLGHGIGLETHEPPRLRKSEPYPLGAGMVFSVEPGIYLPGVTGIRIEDIVVLEDAGPRLLTASPREAVVVG